jgi:hypothetical protein
MIEVLMIRSPLGVVIPDNVAGVVDKANPTEPRINWAFSEYAQTRG